jgi:hypothetical protein
MYNLRWQPFRFDANDAGYERCQRLAHRLDGRLRVCVLCFRTSAFFTPLAQSKERADPHIRVRNHAGLDCVIRLVEFMNSVSTEGIPASIQQGPLHALSWHDDAHPRALLSNCSTSRCFQRPILAQ